MSSGSLLPQVERLFGAGTVAGLPEAALLERFSARRDELAFEVLVSRHGPLVLGVCRRLLRDPGDVEDAFQATFLVLVRRARSIQQGAALGPWLYGVAYRVATRSRLMRARRREQEADLDDFAAPSPGDDTAWRDLRRVLDEELARLPEKYRAPLVLCYLQGLTHDEAAERLACPVGTVRSRLARGRERLGTRLTRRGLAPAAGLLGASLSAHASGVTTPPILLSSTSQAAARVAAGEVVSSVVSSASAALLEGVLRSMIWNPWRKGTFAATALGVILAGAVFSAAWATGDHPRRPAGAQRAEKTVRRPAMRPLPKYVIEPPDLLTVEVLESLPGRPIAGEHLVRPDGTISLGFYGDVYVAGLSLLEAKEKVVVHLQKYLDNEVLGLSVVDPNGKAAEVAPKDSDKVYVDVSAYNSKFYYVVGDAATPGRFVITGSDTVFDAINLAGGLQPRGVQHQVKLIRRGAGGKPDEVLPVDFDEISKGTDPSTNYQLLPGDRLVVTAKPQPEKGRDEDQQADSATVELRRIERRLDRVEDKLDEVLEALKGARTGPGPR